MRDLATGDLCRANASLPSRIEIQTLSDDVADLPHCCHQLVLQMRLTAQAPQNYDLGFGCVRVEIEPRIGRIGRPPRRVNRIARIMTGQPAGSASGGLAEAALAPAQAPVAWYLGRDGQQFGPVNDAEFRRLFEARQLLPTDLVWREGFDEWQPVATLKLSPADRTTSIAPPTPRIHQEYPAQDYGSSTLEAEARGASRSVQQSPSVEQATARISKRGSDRQDSSGRAATKEPSLEPKRRKRSMLRMLGWVAIFSFFTITLGAAYLVVAGDRNLLLLAKTVIPNFGDRITTTPPIGGFAATLDVTDQGLQQSRLWQVLKKNYPEWYAERVRDATEAKRASKSDKEIAVALMQSVVALRRKYAGDATAAPFVRLKSIATLFTSNLAQMRSQSIDTCYQFVSAGEGAPAVVALLQSPEHTSALQAQLVEIFEAIAEGRRSPRVYPAPKPQDYDSLVVILESRGWKNADMQLFSDSAALAKASPETVCRLVTEWFESQLKIQDQDLQLRLIVDSLKPVVAG